MYILTWLTVELGRQYAYKSATGSRFKSIYELTLPTQAIMWNANDVWRLTILLRSTSSTLFEVWVFLPPGCIVYDGTQTLTPEDKANIFNQFFCSVFNERIDNLSSILGHGCDYSTALPVHLINDLICTPSEVAKVLKSLNVNKAWTLVVPKTGVKDGVKFNSKWHSCTRNEQWIFHENFSVFGQIENFWMD